MAEYLPNQQMWLNQQERTECLRYVNRKSNHSRAVKSVPQADSADDVTMFSNQGSEVGSKAPTKPMPLTVLQPQLMSIFNTTLGKNAAFTEVIQVLDNIPNLDFDANVILSSAVGIFYETSKRVQFRLGLFLNVEKEKILDCRRLKGDSFVMNNFFTLLTKKMSEKPELGVTVVYEEEEDDFDFYDDDEDDMEDLDALFGEGHLQLNKDPKLVKHLMKEIETSDLETQVTDAGLLAHAAELESNVKTLVTEGGAPLVKLLEGKLQHDNAALVRMSAVVLKELTRMHPEIFSEKTARTMVKTMGKWAPKAPQNSTRDQPDLVSSKSTVTNLAEGISSLMKTQTNLVKSIKLDEQFDEESVTGIINTLQKYPSPNRDNVVKWMSEMVC